MTEGVLSSSDDEKLPLGLDAVRRLARDGRTVAVALDRRGNVGEVGELRPLQPRDENREGRRFHNDGRIRGRD